MLDEAQFSDYVMLMLWQWGVLSGTEAKLYISFTLKGLEEECSPKFIFQPWFLACSSPKHWNFFLSLIVKSVQYEIISSSFEPKPAKLNEITKIMIPKIRRELLNCPYGCALCNQYKSIKTGCQSFNNFFLPGKQHKLKWVGSVTQEKSSS